MVRLLAAVALAISWLTGCAGVVVSDGANELKGVPFYVKTPVAVQETLRASSETKVQVRVLEILDIGGAAKVLRSTDLPASGALRIAEANRDVIRRQLGTLPQGLADDYDKTLVEINRRIDKSLMPLSVQPMTSATCTDTVPTVSNSWSVTMAVDPKRHFVYTRQPLFGSSNTAFDFGPDGTMSKVSADVKNDTAATLLALFPISAKLSQRWGLAPSTVSKTAADVQQYRQEMMIPGAGAAKKPTPKEGVSNKVEVEVTVTEVKTVYLLRRAHHFKDEDVEEYLRLRNSSQPLWLCKAMNGTDGHQLISITSIGDQPAAAAPDAAAWQLRGSVTPPKEAAEKKTK